MVASLMVGSAVVFTALVALGYQHHVHGRPLPDDVFDPPEMIVERVLAYTRANPFADGVEVNRATVEQMIMKHYLDMLSWPFKALFPEFGP